MEAEKGISYHTEFSLPSPPPVADLTKLLNDSDPQWLSYIYPWSPQSYLKAATHIRWFTPIAASEHPSIIDLWLTPVAQDDSFTNETIGSIADQWSTVLENYRPDSPFTTVRLANATKVSDMTIGTDTSNPPFKYPTVSMGLDFKRVLPPEGVRWL